MCLAVHIDDLSQGVSGDSAEVMISCLSDGARDFKAALEQDLDIVLACSGGTPLGNFDAVPTPAIEASISHTLTD